MPVTVPTPTVTGSWCWIDLETDGLGRLTADHDHIDSTTRGVRILEVGLRVTDTDLATVTEASWVVPWSRDEMDRMRSWATDIVQGMHAANGLWDACVAAWEDAEARHRPRAGRRAIVRCQILDWLRAHADGMPLAGSSVGQADQTWLLDWIPEAEDVLHHRVVDVSSSLILAQAWASTEVLTGMPMPKGRKEHRVGADIEDSIELARWVRSITRYGPPGA
jgi:oligoribonuclease (3'-5' exoribonuclease)